MGKVIVKMIHNMNRSASVKSGIQISIALSLFMFVWCQDNQAVAASPIMHNSTNTSTTYGTWGTTKSCNWCHTSNTTSNVKRVLQNITTPTGKRQVIFTRMTASTNSISGVMGNDNRTYAVNASTNVCEVCHHKTKYHRYSSNAPDKTHANNQDCTGCHVHATGFKASCDSCHGNPPASNTAGPGGMAKNNANQTTGFTSYGAHVVHATTEGMKCASCHNNNTTGGHPGNTVQLGFSLNNTNWPGFVGTAAYGTYSGTTLTAPFTYASSDAGTIVRTAAGARNSCNVYCHGAWTNSNGTTNPRWTGGPTDAACGTCHGATNAQPPLTGTHPTHVGDKQVNYSFSCTKCHPSVATGNFSHLDGSVQWRLSTGSNMIGSSATYRSAASGSTGTVAPSATFGTCANIYCHSTVQGANGSGNPTTYQSVQWGSAALTCAGCHVDMSGAGGTGDHPKHANTYAFSCRQCHGRGYSFNTISTTTHVNRNINLNFSLGTIAPTTTYSKTNSFLAGSAVYGTCSNSYCHSNGQGVGGTGAKTFRTPTWGTTTINCGSCHQNMATFVNISSGDHKMHAQTYAFACSVCHGATYSSTTVPTGAGTTHVNGQINLSFTGNAAGTVYNKGTAYAPGTAYTTCRTSYCHSNAQGQGGTGAVTYRQPTWGTTTMSCGSCHQNMATFTNISSGDHKAHAQTAAYTCNVCHGSGYTNTSVPTGAGSTHVNKLINLAFTGTAVGTTYGKGTAGFAPGTAYQSCSTSPCHGSGTPTWGGSLWSTVQCSKCHSSMATIAADGNFYSTSYPTKVSGNTVRPVGAHFNHLSTNTNRISNSASCRDCHAVPATVNAAGHMNGTSAPAFPTGSLARGLNGTVFPTFSSVQGSCATTYCHGDSLKSNKNARGAKLTAIQKSPRWATPFMSANHATAPTAADCGACHGFPPSSAAHKGVAGYQQYTASLNIAPASSNCNACHKHVNANGTFPAWGMGLHINGVVEGGDCIGCHTGEQSAGSVTRYGAASQFTAQSHHVQGRAVKNEDCYVCHWEANSDGSVNSTYHDQVSGRPVELADWTAGSRSASTFISYTATGTRTQITKLNSFCTGCHNNTNLNLAPFTATPADTGTTSKYAWETSKTSIAARYGQTGTTKWGKYSTANTNRKSQMKKAYSAHGNAANNEQGWSPTGGVDGVTPAGAAITPKAIPNNTGAVVVACYDCHNSHGSAASGITSSYSSATGRNKGGLLKTTQANRAGYTVTYTPTTGGTDAVRSGDLYNPGAAVCFDCHIKLQNSGAPWGYNTFGATQPILGYWDTRYFGNYTTFPSTRYTRFPYKSGTGSASLGRARDMGQNFGGHFGKYSTMATSPKSDVKHLCTPCHDPHGVSPTLSGNQQYSVPLLKGTWITSPYREDIAPPTTNLNRGGGSKQTPMPYGSDALYRIDQNTFKNDRTGTRYVGTMTGRVFANFSNSASKLQNYSSGQFAGLCFRCHTKSDLNATAAASSTNWKTMTRVHNSVAGWASTGGGNATNKVHDYTCSKCHAPHNSRLPRLLVTNCLNVQHRGRVASGGSVSATVGTNTAGNLLSSVNSTTGAGAGRFPSGGARYTGTQAVSTSRARYPGPWMFGVAQSGSAAGSYATNCHNTATSGGATYTPNNQRWNNVSPW